MTSGSGILWPRHEVLQLINPAIPQAGKSLSQGLAIEAIRQLAKMQSPDGSIRYTVLFACLANCSCNG